ncbi:MAG: hypothetical protein ACLGG7_02365 [Bacteriovoracia bacterium]
MKAKLALISFLLTSSLSAQIGPPPTNDYRTEIRTQEATRQLENCVNTVEARDQNNTFDTLRGVLRNCRVRSVDPDSILWSRVPGVGNGAGHVARLKEHEARVQAAKERQNKEDMIDTATDFIRFDQVQPTQLSSAREVLGDQGVQLSSDITLVMLHLQRSDDLAQFANRPDKPRGPGIEELMRLAQMAEIAQDPDHGCRQSLDFRQISGGDPDARAILWDVKGRHSSGERVSPMQLFFGFKAPEELDKLDAYRWQKDGKLFYLFRQKGEGQDKWVMGEYVPATGKLRMRHFRVVTRDMMVKLNEGLVDLPEVGISSRTDLAGMKSEVSGEIGLSIDSYKEELPWGGEVTLPTGTITLSQMKLVQVNNNIYTDQQVQLQSDRVSVQSTVASADSTNWQASFQGHKRTLDGQWSAGSQVRVYNFVAGYQKDSSGGRNVSMGLFNEEAYLQYDTNTVDSSRVTVGRTFGKGRTGAVALRTDLQKKTHEVQVVLFF